MTENLQKVQAELAKAMLRSERPIESVHLVAVSKTKPIEEIIPVLESGHLHFGENKVQECRDKWVDLKAKFPDAILHLIGSVQTNKIKYLPELVDVIECVDRLELAEKIKKTIDKNPTWNPQCFIQVNTGAEPQKSGILPSDADDFIAQCKRILGNNITGLMCIPPVNDNPALHFALLRKIARRNNITELSMGMSADYNIAVEFDATYVRVGTAIFGGR